MLLGSVLVLFLTENTFSESSQSSCALSGGLYGGVFWCQWGDLMWHLIRGRGLRWVWLEWHHHHQQLGTRRGSWWALVYHPSVSLFYSCAKNVDNKFYVNYFLLLSSATATLKYRASLNNSPDKPGSAQTSTGNVPILCRLYESAAVADVSLSLCFK